VKRKNNPFKPFRKDSTIYAITNKDRSIGYFGKDKEFILINIPENVIIYEWNGIIK